MDLRKKIKNFFTLTRKANAGFTLVELIVVIAILAILGGVAVPAYSGYVKKAERSADEALLNEINTAFASACAVNGTDQFNLPSTPTITLEGEDGAKTVASVSLFNEDFMKFFEGGTFKVMTKLYYDGQLGAFKDMASNIFNQIFSGLTLTDEKEKLAASVFGTIGTQELMNKIDVVTDLVAKGGDAFAAMLVGTDGANIDAMAKAMGYTGMTDAKFQEAHEANLAAKMAEGMTEDEALNYILANYAVLQTAKTTTSSTKTTTEWLTNLQSGNYVEMTKKLINKNDAAAQQEGMSQAAMVYAMYTAYANGLEGDAKTAALENVQSVDKFITVIGSDTGFESYLKNEDGKAEKDLEGYLASLSIIDKSVTGNGDAVSDLLLNGYNNPDLVAGLNGLLG